jgi:hypothetical protein
MTDVFIGSEALALGALSRGQLRWRCQAIFPDVYFAKSVTPSREQVAVGAWLWSRRRGVIAGIAAAAIHGAPWFDQRAPVELIYRRSRPPAGIVTRNERFEVDEIIEVAGIRVTSPERTAFDIARHLQRDSAVSHLDALASATGVRASDVWPLVDRYPGARGSARAVTALSLMDGGSASARQTQLRLGLIDSGLARPMTHIEVTDGDMSAFVDMGYQGPMVGVVCGDAPMELFHRMGWAVIRADGCNTPQLIAYRVKVELRRRGYVLSTMRRRP